MKILLFGRDGQLGQALQHSLAPLGEVVALGRAPGPVVDGQALCGDVLDAEGVAQTIGRVRPDVVVNAAAYTAVDRAAQEPALAWAVNSAAPLAMARAAAAHGAWLVHYSTDYVFDGTGSRPWHEADLPSPRNVYGHSKLAGDDGVRAACPRHLILRTSWLYSLVRPNFASAVLRKMTTQDELQIVADQVGAPTSAERVAAITVEALRGAVSSSTPMAVGTYHLAAAGETSWFDYARHLQATAEKMVPGARSRCRLVPVSSQRYAQQTPGSAPRPLNSRLDTTGLREAFAVTLPPWQYDVDRFVAAFLANGRT